MAQFPYRSPRLEGPIFDGPVAWSQENYAGGTFPVVQASDYAIRYGYYPSQATLDGPHFRIPYHFYTGITADYQPRTREGMNARQIGGELILRPPIIPRRNATKLGIANALIFQMEYANSGGPQNVPYIATPRYPRR